MKIIIKFLYFFCVNLVMSSDFIIRIYKIQDSLVEIIFNLNFDIQQSCLCCHLMSTTQATYIHSLSELSKCLTNEFGTDEIFEMKQ